MAKRQKQVVELELKYNLNPNAKQAELNYWENTGFIQGHDDVLSFV